MIVNIRGTSGSGKSFIIRQVMELYKGAKNPVRVEKRKQPLGYTLYREPNDGPPLAIIGHYESPCGGCDTITKQDYIYELIRQAHDRGADVMYEGLLLSAEFHRAYALHTDGIPYLVIGLDVELSVCLDSVNQRRWTKDPTKPPVNPKTTTAKFKGVQNTMKKLQDHGVDARWASRGHAYQIIRETLDV